jgi:hypothetical protein
MLCRFAVNLAREDQPGRPGDPGEDGGIRFTRTHNQTLFPHREAAIEHLGSLRCCIVARSPLPLHCMHCTAMHCSACNRCNDAPMPGPADRRDRVGERPTHPPGPLSPLPETHSSPAYGTENLQAPDGKWDGSSVERPDHRLHSMVINSVAAVFSQSE